MNSLLVIIDVQNGFLSNETKDVPKQIEAITKNNSFDHIVCTQFKNHDHSAYESFFGWSKLKVKEEQRLHPFIEKISEKIFVKSTYTCFTDEFIKYISDNQISHVYLAGIDTDCCVLKCAADCFDHNILCDVIINCCGSNGGKESHEAGIKVLSRLIGKKHIIEM